MLNWGALIGEHESAENTENSPASGESPHCFSPDYEIVGKQKPSNGAGYKAISPLSPLSPLKNRGYG